MRGGEKRFDCCLFGGEGCTIGGEEVGNETIMVKRCKRCKSNTRREDH